MMLGHPPLRYFLACHYNLFGDGVVSPLQGIATFQSPPSSRLNLTVSHRKHNLFIRTHNLSKEVE